jgi:large subunit ribosomal protein L21
VDEKSLASARSGKEPILEVFSVYAVVETGGKQYRVTVGQVFDVEGLSADKGESVTLDKVLLVADGNKVTVGKPTVSGASVSATVVEHGLKRKVIIFHFMPKQRYRVKRGHRQPYTRLRIDGISI